MTIPSEAKELGNATGELIETAMSIKDLGQAIIFILIGVIILFIASLIRKTL